MTLIVSIIGLLIIGFYFYDIRKIKFGTKKIIVIGLFVSMSFMLYMIHLIKYPQGGGITFFSMLPIMILGIIYGRREAMTCGILFGILKLMDGGIIINPAQFLLDFILPCMALGLSGIFGKDKQWKVFLGCMVAGLLGTFSSFMSGVLYFSQYAPEGMNPYLYSFIYNFSSAGVETVITSVAILFVPIKLLSERLCKDESRTIRKA